jgi:hypothetical protein
MTNNVLTSLLLYITNGLAKWTNKTIMGYILWVGLTFPPLLKYIHPRNLIRKLASLIGWRNHDIYNVSSSQVWPSHIIFTEAISLERSFLICLSSTLQSNFTWHIFFKCYGLWLQYMWWSTNILLQHGYMEYWMFRWKSWVEELIHKQVHQFSSKFPKASYIEDLVPLSYQTPPMVHICFSKLHLSMHAINISSSIWMVLFYLPLFWEWNVVLRSIRVLIVSWNFS